jgi:uncharacterized protein YggE
MNLGRSPKNAVRLTLTFSRHNQRTLLPQLIAEARAKAQSLAETAGVKLGTVVGLSENAYGYGAPAGGYLTSGLFHGNSSSGSSGTQYTFYAMVKFATQ